MRLYIVRHGETEWNRMGYMQGRSDISLNLFGVKQAHLCAKRLSKIPFDAIYSSPQKRALETAEILSFHHKNIDFYTSPFLQEIECGVWQGLTWAQIVSKYPSINFDLIGPKKIAEISGGESWIDFKKRVNDFLEWVSEFDYETVLVCAHGGVIKAVVCLLLNLDVSIRSKFYVHNTSISIIEKKEKDGDWKLVTLNDYSHLDAFTYNQKTLESDRI